MRKYGSETPRKRKEFSYHVPQKTAENSRKQYDGRFKAQVAIEAIKNQQTVAQIASHYGVHPTQVSQWKKQALEQLPQLLANGRPKAASDNNQLVDELYRQIGQLKVELDWLQKKTQLLC